MQLLRFFHYLFKFFRSNLKLQRVASSQKQRTALIFKKLYFLIYQFLGHFKVFSQTAFAHKFSASAVNELLISSDVNAVQLFSAPKTALHYLLTTLQR